MPKCISTRGWSEIPDDSVLKSLEGRILHLWGWNARSKLTGWVPLGEFLWFARVVQAEVEPVEGPYHTCVRCEQAARCRFTVEWETGFVSCDGDVVCEHCVDGVVTRNADAIPFGPQISSSSE